MINLTSSNKVLDTNDKRAELYNQRVMNYTVSLLWIFISFLIVYTISICINTLLYIIYIYIYIYIYVYIRYVQINNLYIYANIVYMCLINNNYFLLL